MAGKYIRAAGGYKRRMSRISDERMAELKQDEAVLNSKAKREGREPQVTFRRCGCGSPDCGGWATDLSDRNDH